MLKIFPIGGISGVTKNMFVYEVGDDMIIVDCGIGFPDETMPGVEFLIPDVDYLVERLSQGATLHGIALTHGHDDHIAALPYLLREINIDPPIYASPLTAEFAMSRMSDSGIEKQVEVYQEGSVLEMGPFKIEAIKITHSIPQTRHLAIHTPEGTVYHGSDFKLDLTPIDGEFSDLQKVAEVGRNGVLCALIDCLRIERELPAPSEATIEATLREEMRDVSGKVVVTLMSSSIHRIQQVINAAAEFGRRVTFIGRSVEQNVNTAMNLGLLSFPPETKVNKRKLADIPDEELCVIVAGSQGQPGSSMVRAVFGQHPILFLQKGDKVIFSSDTIPGSERFVNRTINEIAAQGIEVVYSDVEEGLHVSGHASKYEQMLLLHLLRPKYVFPVGGEERHRVLFGLEVRKHGYKPAQVVLPKEGKIVEFQDGQLHYGDQIHLRQRTVDASGMASVIAEHLDERSLLGKNGALVIAMHEVGGSIDPQSIAVHSRGMSFGDEATHQQLLDEVREFVLDLLSKGSEIGIDASDRLQIEDAVTKVLQKEIGTAPLVMVVVSSV